jgi:GR25 family glycosyltransferase involved in LPS biosynthesis
MLPKVYVISLPHRKDRREKLIPQLIEQDIKVIWVQGIKGADMGFRYPFDKTGSYNGLLGCHATHLALWKEAKEPIIIIEDDCKFIGNLKQAYEQIMDRTETIHFFGWSTYASKKYEKTEIEGIVIPEKPLATHCYLYRPDNDLINDAALFKDPIDIVTSRAKCTANYPMIAIQDEGKSDITGTYTNYNKYMK